jgi:histidine triad (HIT) family protein
MPEPCPFCYYAGPSEVLLRTEDFIVIEPLGPCVPGHLLVIPVGHEPATSPVAIGDTVRQASNVAGMILRGDLDVAAWSDVRDYNVIVNCRPDAEQTVDHLHVHLVPRRPADGVTMPWS